MPVNLRTILRVGMRVGRQNQAAAEPVRVLWGVLPRGHSRRELPTLRKIGEPWPKEKIRCRLKVLFPPPVHG